MKKKIKTKQVNFRVDVELYNKIRASELPIPYLVREYLKGLFKKETKK